MATLDLVFVCFRPTVRFEKCLCAAVTVLFSESEIVKFTIVG